MARYFATQVPSRSELLPAQDDEGDLAAEALLDDVERRKLQSYRPPSNVDPSCCDSVPTVRFTQREIEELLDIARATVDSTDFTDASTAQSTVPPPVQARRRTAVRRSDVVMTDVRARLRTPPK